MGASFVIGWLAAWLQTRRHGQALLKAIEDSTRGRAAAQRGAHAGGFLATIEPAPPPFRQLRVVYRAASIFNPLGLIARLIRPVPGDLLIQGKLSKRPNAELLWIRGQAPGRAMSKAWKATLWVQHRLDIINSEYATRGANTAALEHVFVALQSRFGPLLRKVSVQAEEDPELELLLQSAGFAVEELSTLIMLFRAAGQAALQE